LSNLLRKFQKFPKCAPLLGSWPGIGQLQEVYRPFLRPH